MSSVARWRRLLAGVAAALLAGAAVAQGVFRTLPEDAPRGTLSFVGENVVTLDDKQVKLAPGAQIRGANNLIVLPAALPRNSLVKYQLDGTGQLFRAWVMTPEEIARPDKSAAPKTQWSTSPEPGRSIESILGTQPENRLGLRPGEQRPPPPGAPAASQ